MLSFPRNYTGEDLSSYCFILLCILSNPSRVNATILELGVLSMGICGSEPAER